MGVFNRKREHQGPYKWNEVQLKIRMPDWADMMGLKWQPSFEEIATKERSWRGREAEAAKAELQDALQLLQRFRDFGIVPDLVVTALSLQERTSLASWDCANRTTDEVRKAIADLLGEVETEVRQAARVYVKYLMKIFRGTSTGIPRWGDAEGFVADKYQKMQSRLRALEDTETRLLIEIEKILPLHREFVELHDLYNVQEGQLRLLVKVAELRAERARLEEWLREQNLVKKDLEEALRMQRPPLLPRRKTIVIDLNGLLMKVGRSKEELAAVTRLGYDIVPTSYAKTWFVPRPGMAGFLRRCMEWFNIAHNWSHEHCTAYQTAKGQHKDGFLRCNSVHVLYDFCICTKDVIIIDDFVQKNSPNHPFQAVHPRPFEPFQTAKKDENYLNKVLQPFLDKFRGHRVDGISYVEANWHQAQGQDPIACLANYWAPMDERDEDFLWSNCTAADRQKFMAELHGHRIQRAGQKAMHFAMVSAITDSRWGWPLQ
ncbi:hypothetical protein R1sor_023356 [Riccia sorocarpa]|uniref:FCP1 homology domain-containing protein n=1 Tax=Riccia sorocarpa TaxID=122646 RepID=A0ABD3GME6_9MARC